MRCLWSEHRGCFTLGTAHSFFESRTVGNIALVVHVREGDVSLGDGSPEMVSLPPWETLCGKRLSKKKWGKIQPFKSSLRRLRNGKHLALRISGMVFCTIRLNIPTRNFITSCYDYGKTTWQLP